MTLDRWRGRPGVLGWCVQKWDVWMIRRFVRRILKESRRR